MTMEDYNLKCEKENENRQKKEIEKFKIYEYTIADCKKHLSELYYSPQDFRNYKLIFEAIYNRLSELTNIPDFPWLNHKDIARFINLYNNKPLEDLEKWYKKVYGRQNRDFDKKGLASLKVSLEY
jgi:hypothetical protein